MAEYYAKEGNVSSPIDRKSVSIPIMMEALAQKQHKNNDVLAKFGREDAEVLDKRSSNNEGGGLSSVELAQRKS